MTNILHELWNGRVAPIETFHFDESYRKKQHDLIEAERLLTEQLNEITTPLYEKLDRSHAELDKVTEQLIFSKGFSLAVRLILAALWEG